MLTLRRCRLAFVFVVVSLSVKKREREQERKRERERVGEWENHRVCMGWAQVDEWTSACFYGKRKVQGDWNRMLLWRRRLLGMETAAAKVAKVVAVTLMMAVQAGQGVVVVSLFSSFSFHTVCVYVCGAVRCDVMWCSVVRCGAVRCRVCKPSIVWECVRGAVINSSV